MIASQIYHNFLSCRKILITSEDFKITVLSDIYTSPQQRQACHDVNRLQPQDHGGAFHPYTLCEPIKKSNSSSHK